MSDQPYGVIGIPIQGKLDDTYHLFFSGISQILILIIVLLVNRVQYEKFIDFPTVSRSKTCLLADLQVILHHAPQLYLVLLVDREQHVLLVEVDWIPNASSWEALLLYWEYCF